MKVRWHWEQQKKEVFLWLCFRQQNPVSWQQSCLGIGRAIGETMAVIMVAGNQARMPAGLLKGLRTMTANIVTEMGYATGSSQRSTDRNRCSTFCIYPDHQPEPFFTEQEVRECKLTQQTINQIVEKMKKEIRQQHQNVYVLICAHPGSGVLALLTVGAAVITFAVLIFLVGLYSGKGYSISDSGTFSVWSIHQRMCP